MAVENYSTMVSLMPTTKSKIETVQQAHCETKHIQLLTKVGKRLAINVADYIVEPQWLAIRETVSIAAKSGDLASCIISQDLMTELMAIVLYRTLSRDNIDPYTRQVAANILRDELEHLDTGINRVKEMLAVDHKQVYEAFAWSHHRVMPKLFSMLSYSCESLCDVVNVKCGSLNASSFNTDLDTIRMEALDLYMEVLDKVGIPTEIATPLVASLSSYGGLSSEDEGSPHMSGCCS